MNVGRTRAAGQPLHARPSMRAMHELLIRPAVATDVPSIVALLVDDHLGASRESAEHMTAYVAAFERISIDPNAQLMVAVRDGSVVGTLTLTFLHGLARQGATRALVEAVRVQRALRNQGIGRELMLWAIDESRAQGAALMQLTSDRSRVDAHRFYERLGFEPSHVGFKLQF